MKKREPSKSKESQRITDPKKQKALDWLLAGKSITATAKALSVNPSTIHAWLKTDDFAAAYAGAVQAASEQTARQFKAMAGKSMAGALAALTELRRVLADAAAPAAVRVQAGAHLISAALKLRELDFDESKTALETPPKIVMIGVLNDEKTSPAQEP